MKRQPRRIGKLEMIETLAVKNNITKADARKFLDSCVDIIETGLARGDSIVIPNFGTFKVQKVKPRIGQNMHSGEAVRIPARRRIKFTPSPELNERIK